MTEHWIDTALREHRLLNLNGHQNFVRISAQAVIKLHELRNKLTGGNRSLYEQHLLDEEQNVII